MDQPIKKNILDSIERLSQKPKWHFVAMTIVCIVGLVVILGILLYLASFIIFTLSEQKVMFAPEFGWRGIGIFIMSLPWLLILASLILILAFEALMRRYALVFRRPLVYSLIGLVLIVAFGGIALTHAHVNEHMQGRWPMEALYHGYVGRPLSNLHTGVVQEIDPNGFMMKNRFEELLSVIVSSHTRFPHGEDIETDDSVLVVGQRTDHKIKAEGIRCLNDRVRIKGQKPAQWQDLK